MKPEFEQFADCRDGCFGVVSLGGQYQFGSLGCAQRQQRQNAAAVNLFGTFLDHDGRIKTVRTAHQQIGWAGMQPLWVDDDHSFLELG